MTNTAPYLLAFTLPLVVTALLTPVAGRLARRKGFVEHPQGRKVHHRATPSLGGLAVAAGLAMVGLTVAGASGQIAVLVLGAGAVAVVGLVDDWRDLGPLPKLAVETGAALALWFAGVGAGLFGVPVLDAALTVLWVLTVTNALNFVDNMDGLASGLSAISAFGFFGIAASQGDYLVASLALATTGAALGFLWHNFPPAKIFLGDAGSLLLGFLLASLGLKLDLVGESGWVRSAIPLLVLAVPLFDMALVVVARVLEGRPVHLGSTDHSSHRLRGRGMSVRDVALASYAVQAVCVVAAFMLYDASWDRVLLGSSLALAVALAALALMLRTAPLPHAVAGEGTPSDTP